MSAFSLSWIFGFGAQAKGGRNKLPSWDDILSCLEKIRDNKGSVTLDVVTEMGVGSQSLQVLSDSGRYVVSLEEDDGVDYFVRSYRNAKLQGMKVEVLGDIWDGVFVCNDFYTVKSIFEEFFLTGDVSKEWLD
jgi:hypothetical protein